MYIYADTILTNLIYTNTIRMSLTGTRYFPWSHPSMAKIYLVVPTEVTCQFMIGRNSWTTKGRDSLLGSNISIMFLVGVLPLLAMSPAWKCKLPFLSWWVSPVCMNYTYMNHTLQVILTWFILFHFHMMYDLYIYKSYHLRPRIDTNFSVIECTWIRRSTCKQFCY